MLIQYYSIRSWLQHDSVRCCGSYIPAIIHKAGGLLGAGGYPSFHYTRTAREYPHWDKTAVPSMRPLREGARHCAFVYLSPSTVKTLGIHCLTKYQIVSCKLTEEDIKRKGQEKWKGKKIKALPCQSKNSLKTILIKKSNHYHLIL